jgi:hypothetical protein
MAIELPVSSHMDMISLNYVEPSENYTENRHWHRSAQLIDNLHRAAQYCKVEGILWVPVVIYVDL